MGEKNEEALSEALEKLGFFTGNSNQHQFMARLLDMAQAPDGGPGNPGTTLQQWSAINGPSGKTGKVSEQLINGLLGLTDGGMSAYQFQQICDQYILEGYQAFEFAEEEEAVVDPLVAYLDAKEDRGFTMIFQGDDGFQYRSKYKVEDFKLGGQINKSHTAPTTESPNIAFINFHDVALNFANRDTGVAGVFLNMIPTIEMSKCQPYVDVRVITAFPPIETSSTGTKRIGAGISQMRFLNGTAEIKDNKTLEAFAGANAGAIDHDTGEFIANSFNTFTDGEDPPSEVEATISGMELFTSPQTLNDAENNFVDLSPRMMMDENGDGQISAEEQATGGFNQDLRNTPTLDKFRPFMTFKSISFNVAPTRGMMSTEAGDIAFTLHDRSRLADIAQFVRPSSVGKDVELFIEWGWSHPEAGQADGQENYFADLLNAMRVKKKYRVVNSTLNFNAVGEVDIKCKIVSAGAKETTRLLITTGEIEDQLKVITEMTKTMRIIKKRIRADLGDNEELAGDEILGKANSASAILGLNSEDLTEVTALAKALSSGASGDYKDLGKELAKALGKASSLQGKITKWFTKTSKYCHPKSSVPDPWLKSQPDNKIRSWESKSSSRKHVSFAKLCMYFIAKPLAASKRFTEVQCIFYPFNAQAAFAAPLDIGSFPINYTKFIEIMEKEFKKRPNMTVAQFIGRMNQNFFANMACDGYGFGNIYDRDEDGKAKLKKAYTGSAANSAKARNAKIDVLEKAYGPDADPKFKRPQVQMYIEAVPGQRKSGGVQCTMLRLHFFDKACTSYTGFTQMWDSMRSSMMSSINSSAVAVARSVKKDGGTGSVSEQTAKHYKQWEKQFATIAALDMLEIVDPDGSAVDLHVDLGGTADAAGNSTPEDVQQKMKDTMANLSNKQIRIKGGPSGLRYVLSKNMPTIKYGTQTSAVIQANLSTKTDSKLATIHMTKQKEPGKRMPGDVDDGLPLRTFPTELKLDLFGFPLVSFGQQFFVDFATGTSMDDVYVVTGIDHQLTPGEFKTSLKMTPMMKFGQFQSLLGNIAKITTELAGLDKDQNG